MSADDVMLQTEEAMEKAVTHLSKEFRQIRTGRATPSLVENISVTAYGSQMPMKQCGTISVPEARQLVIKPFDPSILKELEKAILASGLGVTPQSDGKLLRLQFPPLTEQRRKELAKDVKSKGEEGKISIRRARQDGLKLLDGLKKDKLVTEDELKGLKDTIQELVKKYEAKVDAEVAKKSDEIMEI